MSNDLLRILRANDDRLRQTETKEVPGGIPGFTSFYAAGVWTPAWSGTLTLGSYTYTVQQGFYRRIGSVVNVWGRVAISAIAVAPTGVMVIFGLPFACAAVAGSFGAVSWGYVSNLNLTAGAYLTGLINTGESQIRLEENFDNAPAVGYPVANFNNVNCDITFFGSYPV